MEYDPKQALELFMGKLNNFLELQFESIFKRLKRILKRLVSFLKKLANTGVKYHTKKGESCDIGTVAYDDQNIAFGECKWTSKKVSIGDYEKLMLRSNYTDIHGKRKMHVLFSKSGFEEDLLKMKSDTFILLTPEDMAKIMGL